MHSFDSVISSKYINVENKSSLTMSGKNTGILDCNHAHIYYEHLQGGLVLICIYHCRSMPEPALIMQRMYASNYDFQPFCFDAQMVGITFSEKPNSDEPKYYHPLNNPNEFKMMFFLRKSCLNKIKEKVENLFPQN